MLAFRIKARLSDYGRKGFGVGMLLMTLLVAAMDAAVLDTSKSALCDVVGEGIEGSRVLNLQPRNSSGVW